MINRFWQDYERSRSPELSELKQLLQGNGDYLPDDRTAMSERFMQLQFFYGYLFFGYISAGTGLNFLNHRMNAKGWLSLPYDHRSFYQKFSYDGTDHFYIGNFIHIERLSEMEKRTLSMCLVDKENAALIRRAGMIVKNSYKKVLASAPENSRARIEIQTKNDGTVVIDGKTLILGVFSMPAYNEEGQYRDVDDEVQRRRVMKRIKDEVQEKLTKFLNVDVCVLRDET